MATTNRVTYLLSFVLLFVCVRLQAASAAGTEFTYQGRLKEGAAPAAGTYDFRFTLFDSAAGGSAASSALEVDGLAVASGIVVAPLDFGGAPFNGDARWLEILVRTNGPGAFTTLTPRQPLTPGPYALRAGSVPAGGLQGLINNASLSGDIARLSATGQVFTAPTVFKDWVGIGTAIQARPLDVAGAGPAGEWLGLHDGSGATVWHLNNSQGGLNFAQTGVADDRLFLSTNGNVGIGTDNPGSKLTVNGDIRLGAAGQYLAPGAPERLRIVRGVILSGGTVASGFGFTVFHNGIGHYTVTLTPGFSDVPAITALPATTAANLVSVTALSASSFHLLAFTTTGFPTEPAAICFTATGAP